MGLPRLQRRLPILRPGAWTIACAMLAHLLLPAVLAAHATVGHADHQVVVLAAHDDAGSVPADQPDSPPIEPCDLCCFLGALGHSADLTPAHGTPIDVLAALGGIPGIDQSLVGQNIPVVALPRAPPLA